MLYKFELNTNIGCFYLSGHLKETFKWLKERGYNLEIEVRIDENNNYQTFLITLNKIQPDYLFSDADIIYIFKHQLSELLAEHILKDWEEKLIIKEIQRQGKKFSSSDQLSILKKTKQFMQTSIDENEKLNNLLNFGRKNKIAYKIMDYIYNHHSILIEGFIPFCLKHYLNEIRFAVDFACEELKNEQEYSEFVKLLRYFVDSQPSRVNQVNLVMDEKGAFHLWDDNGVKIDDTYLKRYLDDLLLKSINLDDMLISILVTIAPQSIIIHENLMLHAKNEAVEIIKRVFADKINICRGCTKCLEYQKEKQHSKHL